MRKIFPIEERNNKNVSSTQEVKNGHYVNKDALDAEGIEYIKTASMQFYNNLSDQVERNPVRKAMNEYFRQPNLYFISRHKKY